MKRAKKTMNHVDLHMQMSEVLTDLLSGKIDQQLAKDYFRGAGRLIANCRNELIAVNMGATIDVPLLGLKAADAKKLYEMNGPKKLQSLSEKAGNKA